MWTGLNNRHCAAWSQSKKQEQDEVWRTKQIPIWDNYSREAHNELTSLWFSRDIIPYWLMDESYIEAEFIKLE